MSQNDRLDGLVGAAGCKVPVRAATTAAITLSGEQTIDGIACVTGDRVLVKNQASGVANGIYVCDTGTWDRAKDADGSYDFALGSLIYVALGSTLAGTVWAEATASPIPDSTALTFTRALFSGLSGVTFLQAGTGAVSRAAQDKMRDIVNVFDFMTAAQIADVKAGTLTLDVKPAIDAAVTAMAAGGILWYPGSGGAGAAAANYKINGTVTTAANGITHKGEGPLAVTITQQSNTADSFVFSTCQFSGIEGMRITNNGTASAGYAVTFNKTGATGCFFGFARDLYIQNTWNGILIRSSTETRVSGVHLRGLLGTRGILFDGTGAGVNASFRAVCDDVVCDTAGNGNTTILWYCQDNYAYSLVLNKCTALYGSTGFAMVDSAATGTSYPIWCYAHDLECDHNVTAGVNLDRGEGFYATNSWIGSCSAGNGVNVGANYRGEVDVGNTRVMGNYQAGITIASGPVDVSIHDNMIGDNSVAGSGTYHGVTVAANATRFYITDNRIGDLVGVAGNNQGYGVFVSAGTSDNYIIRDNNCLGNVTGGIVDSGTGQSKIVRDNLGHVPSPFAQISNIPIGSVAYASIGTSAVHVAGTIYVAEIDVPFARTVTGIAVLNGGTVGTDNLIAALYGPDGGAAIATSALAGALSAGANVFQALAFTAPVTLMNPGRYFIAVQCNGTTATTRRIAAATYLNLTKTFAGVFGTIASLTVPTTTVADAGPIGYLY